MSTATDEMKAPLLIAQADAARLPLDDDAVDMVFTSPFYMDARTYGIGVRLGCAEWIEFMLGVVAECTRVCRGIVLINCAGVTRERCYQPGPEGLLYEWWKRGGQCWRPAYWHRVGIPGSGGKQWLRADIEYVLAFKRTAEWLPWSDNVANGHPPKWGPGGEMSYRLGDGHRRNAFGMNGGSRRRPDGTRENFDAGVQVEVKPMYRRGQNGDRQNVPGTKLHTKSLPDGTDEIQCYTPPVKANPGTLVRVKVGGGLLGHPLAHENEAPFPIDLAAWFIRSHCPPGGTVLDPFAGSHTTCDAAWREGRIGIGFDLRMSQCELGRRRLSNPYEKKSKAKKVNGEKHLWSEVA